MPCNSGTPIPPTVPPNPKLMVWGEMGGADEAARGRPFVGVSGRELRKALRMLRLRVNSAWPDDHTPVALEDVAFNNTVLCRGNSNEFPGFEAARACLASCQNVAEYASLPWLACGANATEALTGLRFKNFLNIRGSLLPTLDVPWKWLTATVHPAFIVRGGADGKAQSQMFPFLAMDAARAIQRSQPWIPKIKAANAGEIHERLWKDPSALVAIDIEGGYQSPITLVGFSWHKDEALVGMWDSYLKDVLKAYFTLPDAHPILHNAAYDIPALMQEGLPCPRRWIDTINVAALVNPSVKLGLESLVLSYVPGSVTWKGLVNHSDIQKETAENKLYRGIHRKALANIDGWCPESPWDWFTYYNGLDAAGTMGIAGPMQKELSAQGRGNYYEKIMKPLQRPLMLMGMRGMPVETDVMGRHHRACERLERMAQRILDDAYGVVNKNRLYGLIQAVQDLEEERATERAAGQRAFTKAKQLTALRTKLRALEDQVGMKGTSYQQRSLLLYEWLGLPPVGNVKTGNATTNETAITGLLVRMKRGTVKPKRGTVAEAQRVCKAMLAISKWSDWRTNFFSLKGED
jgi:uracil-DNA glycosylase